MGQMVASSPFLTAWCLQGDLPGLAINNQNAQLKQELVVGRQESQT